MSCRRHCALKNQLPDLQHQKADLFQFLPTLNLEEQEDHGSREYSNSSSKTDEVCGFQKKIDASTLHCHSGLQLGVLACPVQCDQACSSQQDGPGSRPVHTEMGYNRLSHYSHNWNNAVLAEQRYGIRPPSAASMRTNRGRRPTSRQSSIVER